MTLFCDKCQEEVRVKLEYEDIKGESKLKMFKVSCVKCGALIVNKKVLI